MAKTYSNLKAKKFFLGFKLRFDLLNRFLIETIQFDPFEFNKLIMLFSFHTYLLKIFILAFNVAEIKVSLV